MKNFVALILAVSTWLTVDLASALLWASVFQELGGNVAGVDGDTVIEQKVNVSRRTNLLIGRTLPCPSKIGILVRLLLFSTSSEECDTDHRK